MKKMKSLALSQNLLYILQQVILLSSFEKPL